jgi:putative ABC transport system substrate-binding protein
VLSIKAGLAASLNRPGGNITGVTTLGVELGRKRLEVLHELMPSAAVIAQLVNPNNPPLAETEATEVRDAARAFRLQLHILNASAESEINAAFASLDQLRAGAPSGRHRSILLQPSGADRCGGGSPFNCSDYFAREYLAAGGLMSYGGSLTDTYRQVGFYTGRILKGEKPADLPVQQLTKVELIINLNTAKALGLTIPQTLLARADEVIE